MSALIPSGFEFQSAPPVKRATYLPGELAGSCKVSIRAPREEGDSCGRVDLIVRQMFQSAPPVKRATNKRKHTPQRRDVSIRAPREEGDHRIRISASLKNGFNPRPP